MKAHNKLYTFYQILDFDQTVSFSHHQSIIDQLNNRIHKQQSEIDELKHRLTLEHTKARYWESLHKRNVEKRESTQEKHDVEILELKKRVHHKTAKLFL